MARVTLSGIITDINGSVGGWTFQNGISGKIVRNKPIQKRWGTEIQRHVHEFPVGIREGWGTLTPAEQADWVSYAATNLFTDFRGNTKTLSGYQFFFSSLVRRFLMNTATDLLAPVGVPAPDAMDAYTLTLTATSIELSFAAPFNHPNNQVWIMATFPVSSPGNSHARNFRTITTQPTNNSTTFDFTTHYEDRTGLNWAATYADGNFYIHTFAFLCREESGLTLGGVNASAHN